MSLAARHIHSPRVLILALSAVMLLAFAWCTGAAPSGGNGTDNQRSLAGEAICFTMTPAPKTGRFVIGPPSYVSAPQRLSGSYSGEEA